MRPEDLEGGFSGYWLVSERLRRVMEAVDSEAFAFANADYRLADGSKGPTVFLCDVVRVIDALDEQSSQLTIEISDDFEGVSITISPATCGSHSSGMCWVLRMCSGCHLTASFIAIRRSRMP